MIRFALLFESMYLNNALFSDRLKHVHVYVYSNIVSTDQCAKIHRWD